MGSTSSPWGSAHLQLVGFFLNRDLACVRDGRRQQPYTCPLPGFALPLPSTINRTLESPVEPLVTTSSTVVVLAYLWYTNGEQDLASNTLLVHTIVVCDRVQQQ